MRIDKYLKEKYPEYSRAFFQKLITRHKITVNGHPIKVHEDFKEEKDKLEIIWPEQKILEKVLPDSDLEIVFEDEDVLVVNKPAGIVVHPACGNPTGTLIEQVVDACGIKPDDFADTLRPGLLHRLDKDTSGCIIIAKNALSQNALAISMMARKIDKFYLALVVGTLPRDKGLIDAPLARGRTDRKIMVVSTDVGSKEAQTQYEILGKKKWGKTWINLVKIKLLTGRTHQIRAHMKSVNCFLLGDNTYGKAPVNAEAKEKFGIGRQALHAWKLAFPHPEKEEIVNVTAPIPADMQKVCEIIGIDLPQD